MQHGPVLSVSYHLHETAKESGPQMKLCIYSTGSTQVRFGKMCLQICANAPLWPSWSLVSLVWHNNSFTIFPCMSIDIFSLVLLFTSISLSLSLCITRSDLYWHLFSVRLGFSSLTFRICTLISPAMSLISSWPGTSVVRLPKPLMDQPSVFSMGSPVSPGGEAVYCNPLQTCYRLPLSRMNVQAETWHWARNISSDLSKHSGYSIILKWQGNLVPL